MFFWFIGIGILIFKYVFKDNTADLRFLITGLLILDFVDIILLISPISKDKNFITHSLLFSVDQEETIKLLGKELLPRLKK